MVFRNLMLLYRHPFFSINDLFGRSSDCRKIGNRKAVIFLPPGGDLLFCRFEKEENWVHSKFCPFLVTRTAPPLPCAVSSQHTHGAKIGNAPRKFRNLQINLYFNETKPCNKLFSCDPCAKTCSCSSSATSWQQAFCNRHAHRIPSATSGIIQQKTALCPTT